MVVDETQVPATSLDVANIRSTNIAQRASDLIHLLSSFYRPLLTEYRSDVSRVFDTNFKNNIDPESKQAVWHYAEAKRRRLDQELYDSFDELMNSTEEEASQDMSLAVYNAFDEGYDMSLWEMAQLGVNLKNTDSLSKKLISGLITGAAIGGLTYLNRLSNWSQLAKQKNKQWLKASMVGGFTGIETQQGLEKNAMNLVNQVTALGANEVNRSYLLATQVAREPYLNQIQEVWMTRGDADVCPFCAELHLTVTKLQPEESSHPGCRCQKVAMADLNGKPIDYQSFLQTIGRR